MKLPKPLLDRVQIVLNAPAISTDGGLVLLKKTQERCGLVRRMANRLRDARCQGKVTHSYEKMLGQRVMGICLGWEDCNDFDALRDDPLYTVCLNGKPASQPTLSMFENTVGHKELYLMSQELVQFFIDRNRDRSAKRIVLDLDATDDPAHGQQEFEFYHGYYQTHCFLPLLVFASADEGPMELVAAILRPGNSHAGRRSAAVLRRMVPMLKEAFPEAEILLRADGGFALPEMYASCEELGLLYAISLPKNITLLHHSSDLEDASRAQFAQTGLKAKLFGEFKYSAGTWPKERRVVVKAEVTAKGNNPRFVVTNLASEPEDVYGFYIARADSENRIKELKLDLCSGRTSCHRFSANCFRLLMHAMAYILMTLVRERLAGTSLAQYSAPWARSASSFSRWRPSSSIRQGEYCSDFPGATLTQSCFAPWQLETETPRFLT